MRPLDWETYRGIRAFIIALRTAHVAVTVDTVLRVWSAAMQRGMRRADMCRYIASEAREDKARRESGKREILSEEQWRQLESNSSGTDVELNGKFPEPKNEHESQFPGTVAELVTRQTSNVQTKEPPERANALSAPPGAARVRPTVDPVEFGDEDERRVRQVLAFVAAENKTGTVSAARILALRAEMHVELASLGADRWRYGMDEASARGKPWDYARATMRKNATVPSPAASSRGSPVGRRPGYSDKPPPPEKLALYEQLGSKPFAVRK